MLSENTQEAWPPASQAISQAEFEKLIADNPALHSGRGSVVWRVNSEIILTLGWGRAILMQMAHPAVAAGVAQHSHFSTSPDAQLKRFYHTLNAMLRLSFGTPAQVWKAAHAIDTIHGRVNGTIDGHTRYTARDPKLLKWVHATFADSMLRTYALFVQPLTVAEQNEYLGQAAVSARLLGAPQNYFPTTIAELNRYMITMLRSDVLRVGPQAQHLSKFVLQGLDIPGIGPLLNWYGQLPIAGMLPSSLRQAYGLTWTQADKLALQSSAWTYRQIHPFLPKRLRYWELARKAGQP